MKYLVKAKVRPGCERALMRAIMTKRLGEGSVAYGEYLHNMRKARIGPDNVAHWVETCFCATPLQEERPYWEEFFEIVSVKDAHNRKNCRDANGSEPWACSDCSCTKRLEKHLKTRGESFLMNLRARCEPETEIA